MQQKVIFFQEDGQKRKLVIKIEFTPRSHSPDCNIFPFKKGFKNCKRIKRGISPKKHPMLENWHFLKLGLDSI